MKVSRTNTHTKNSLFNQSSIGVFTEFSKAKEIKIEVNDFYDCSKVAIYNFADDGATTRIGKNTIINSPHAINTYNLNANLNTDYKAKANCIINAYHAVTIKNTPQAEFYYNYIESEQTGLSLAGSQGATIYDNDFVGAGNGDFGIYASMSQASTYNQNRIQGFSNGVQLANDYHSQLTNNVFVDGDIGIYLTNNTELGEQGSPQQPQNNHWLQPHFAEGNPNHFPIKSDDSVEENDATFFYKPDVPELLPWNNGDAQIIATNNGLVAPPYNYFQCPDPAPQDAPPLAGIVPPAPAPTVDYSPSRYIQELQLLALLDHLPANQLSAAHHDFKSQKEHSNQQEVLRIRQEVKEEALVQAQDRNQALNPQNPIEDFTKTFYSALLVWLQDSLPFENLTPQEQATVREWAALCPFEYGPEVYSARTIAHRLDTAWQSYVHPCEGSIPHTLARLQGTEEGLTAYPNPFVDELHLETPPSKWCCTTSWAKSSTAKR